MIKYIGSKRTLLTRIIEVVDSTPDVERVVDLFSGTTRVAQGLKRAGYRVHANDLASYTEVLARCYIEADLSDIDEHRLSDLIDHLNQLPGKPGYFTQTFCEQARYFQPHNGGRIDAIRHEIDAMAQDPLEHAILLTSLMEAADRVDSTTGLQMAYLKQWAVRSYKDLDLRFPELIAGTGIATRVDANQLAPTLLDADLVYIDPPYNQHSYFSNYHIWETLVRNDEPETYGIANKRIDCRTVKSDYNSRRRAHDAFVNLIEALPNRHLLISFNNEGFLSSEKIVELLLQRDEVGVAEVDFKRYVGAQIGIHNPQGKRVGSVGSLRNKELLFLVGPDAQAIMAQAMKP